MMEDLLKEGIVEIDTNLGAVVVLKELSENSLKIKVMKATTVRCNHTCIDFYDSKCIILTRTAHGTLDGSIESFSSTVVVVVVISPSSVFFFPYVQQDGVAGS